MKRVVRYFLIVILPLLMLNGMFLGIFIYYGRKERMDQMEAAAGRIQYELVRNVSDAVSISDYLCLDSQLVKFLEQRYEDERAYYKNFNQLLKDNVIRYYYTAQSVYKVTVATDNETIINGTYFVQREDIQQEEWYRQFDANSQAVRLCAWYDSKSRMNLQSRRHISLVRNLALEGSTAILRLDVNYADMVQNIIQEEAGMDVYLCEGERIIFSNVSEDINGDFSDIDSYKKKKLEFVKTAELYGSKWKIYVTTEYQDGLLGVLPGNRLLLFLVCLFDIIFPAVTIWGFIHMEREKQTLELSKKQAEINALQSQLNPHFMFNTLESIRMKSLLNGEDETEEVLGKFALLLRQASRWDKDFITIREEMLFVGSYLDIQKYRFEDRVAYEISVEECCMERMISKFGILTFVENACIHGIEKERKGGKITLDIRKAEGRLVIEVCDNGRGMDSGQAEQIQRKIQNASMEDLYSASHIGMLNAVVRLKNYFDGDVIFEVSSAKGLGTKINISIPSDADYNIGRQNAFLTKNMRFFFKSRDRKKGDNI